MWCVYDVFSAHGTHGTRGEGRRGGVEGRGQE